MLSINNQNYSLNFEKNKNSVSFKSKLVPTRYLEQGFEEAISQGFEGRHFLKAIKSILNDGLNDIIKIDKTPNSKMSKSKAATYDVFVNDKKVVDAGTSFGKIFDGAQCVNGLIEFAENNKKIMPLPSDFIQKAIELPFLQKPNKGNNNFNNKCMQELLAMKEREKGTITKELKLIKKEIFSKS